LIKEQSEQQAILFMKDLAQYQDYDPNSAGKLLLDDIIQGLKSNIPKEDFKKSVYDLCMTFSEEALLQETINQNDLF
jgi:hypothetical protein